MSNPRTLFDKIWQQHVVVSREGEALLYVDVNFVHEGTLRSGERSGNMLPARLRYLGTRR